MTIDEHLESSTNVEIYCEILLGILRYIPVRNYKTEEEYKVILNKNLKFENLTDDLKFRACIDLTEDTEYAISDFHKNGLITGIGSHGEKYLRLYGLLNSLYLQMQSVIELIELFKIQNKKAIKKELISLPVIQLRNKIGAHTPKFEVKIENGKNTFESYRLTQTSISKWGNGLTLVSSSKKLEEYNLQPLINEFTNRIEFYLDLISDKGINSLFPNMSEHKEWLIYRLEFVRRKKTAYNKV